jgi:V8-like Glu-specific endopeptidase
MAFSLSAEQERDLRAAIVDAFSPGDLGIAVRDHVKDDLHNLTAPGTHQQQAFGLVQACRQRGWLDRLVFGVIAERRDNPKVIDVTRRLGLHPAGPPGGFEKLVGPNVALVDLHPWLARCSVAASRVCQVRVRGQKEGSGFLVGPDTVLTNHHVVASAIDQPDELSFVFDHARAASGEVHPGVAFAGKQVISWSPQGPHSQWSESAVPGEDELDFALVALTEPAGTRGLGGATQGRARGWIDVSPAAHDFAGSRGLAILQHPLGDPVKLALDFADQGRLTSSEARRVRYTVPTQGGSSGSPVFHAESLTLVALHQGGQADFNQGIPISAIAARPAVKAYLASVPRP